MENTLKLLLSLTMTLLLCINPAAGLTCHRCTKANCTDPNDPIDTCLNGQDVCMTMTINETSRCKTTIRFARTCARAEHCVKASEIVSVTTSTGSSLVRVKCCNTDKCNNDSPPVPSAPSGGTVGCPNCDPNSGNCTSTIKCGALDTKCYKYRESDKMTGIEMLSYGCSSENACSSQTVMREVNHFSTDMPTKSYIFCRDPPLQCEVCVGLCQSCSETSSMIAPSDMRCMSATVKEPSGGTLELKGMAGSPLCSSDGSRSLSVVREKDQVNVEILVICCSDSDNCNKDALDHGSTNPEPFCGSGPCPLPPGLLTQLQMLTKGMVLLPTPVVLLPNHLKPEDPEQGGNERCNE